jgi:hypothetical protein
MLNPNTVYFKTDAGIAEVKARALGLRAELRRLLILVDGAATLSRLAVFVRGSEIDYLIAELEILELVATGRGATASVGEPIVVRPVVTTAAPPAPASAASSASPAMPGANAEPTSAQLLAVRREAVRLLYELLGPGADALAVRIERCEDAQALRVAITEIRQTLDRQLNTDAGQRFLDAVRAAAGESR